MENDGREGRRGEGKGGERRGWEGKGAPALRWYGAPGMVNPALAKEL